MMRIILSVMTGAFALLTSIAVIADEAEPPLFVEASGSDAGNCQDPSSPCRTIGYALKRVGKNGQVRIGDGSFQLNAAEDIVYLLSGAIDVRGSYSAGAKTTLIGVPHEYASELSKKGFHIIADTKGASEQRSLSNQKIVRTQQSLAKNAAATPCLGGLAGVFPCNDVDLLAHIADRTPAARGADIWGFLDLNTNREYAIVGYSSGTAVFDVTDPENPREVGFINGQSTTWRDIKVHQFWNPTEARWNAYAYVVADNASDGLFIIDLNQLPHSIARVSYSSDFSAAHNVYLTDTDFSTGLSITGDTPTLILAGSSDQNDGRFRSYSLANPAAPTFIGVPATPVGQPGGDRLYMHDAASMIVTDARKDSQCANAASSDHCDILFDFNESTVDIWDITNTSAPVRLSQTPYSNASYVHSGWWSEDQQFLFVQDELDERDSGLLTTLRIFSISDLTAPTLADTWQGPTTAIDHNGFVRGNRYYMSNYARGLSILDITNAASPVLVGHFDTYPASDSVGFPGNWGAYPFLPSGNIALSDIDSGFYLVSDKSLDVPQGSFSFTASAYGGDEAQTIDLVVQRAGGSQGAASVRWEVLAANGSFDDVTTLNGTLNWADGDAASRTVNLVLNNDGNSEGMERLLVKLTSPTGGATLSSPNIASAYVSDPGSASAIDFSAGTIALSERGFGKAIAIVQRSGNANGAASVDFNISAGSASTGADYTGPDSGTLSWADGNADPKWIEYEIIDDGAAETDEFLELTLSNASGASVGASAILRINILDGSGSNSAPNAIAGGAQTVSSGAAVSLDGSGSNDPDGDTLSYSWTQTLGPGVTLSNATSANATFTAPSVSSDTLLRFTLQVSDPAGQIDTSTASVTVSAGGGFTVGGGGSGGSISLYLLAGLLGLSIVRAIIRKDSI